MSTSEMNQQLWNEQLQGLIAKKLEQRRKTEELAAQFEEEKEILGRYEALSMILMHDRLWQNQHDPGKSAPAYSFLSGTFVPVCVKELLTPEDQQRLAEKGYPRVIQFADVQKHECPNCHSSLPVIQEYEQTEDSPDGDEWRKRFYVACVDCCGVYKVFEDQERDSRF